MPMRQQTMVQLTDELVALLDRRAARDGVSRSQVIREAVEAHLRGEAERGRAERFARAYASLPESDEELATAHANARNLVEEEPW